MSAGKSKGVVPKLRFPEFRDAGGWEVKTLRDICNMRSGIFIPATEIYDVAQSHLFPCFGGNGLRGYVKTSTHEGKHPLIGRQGALCGNVNLVNGAFYATEHAVVVTAKPKVNVDWIYYQLIRLNLNRYATGQAQPGLSVDVLEKVVSITPTDPKEQRRIANCLVSLDDVIAAEGRKLETLRQHKQGLMQQLFPREGETQPRRRFPEFQAAGEWVGGDLGSRATKVGSGITPNGGDKNYKQSGRPFVRSQNVGWGELILDDVAFIDEETHSSFSSTEIKVLDVLLNITGASIGRSAVADGRIAGGNVNQHVCIIRVKAAELNHCYLNQYLISPEGQKQIDSFQAGGNRQGLNFAQIRSFTIPLPPKVSEQRRIADCLTSFDDIIAAQKQKVDTLRTHKQGLLQQLFPSLEEETA
jgi:type I restriction enzyme S subunit